MSMVKITLRFEISYQGKGVGGRFSEGTCTAVEFPVPPSSATLLSSQPNSSGHYFPRLMLLPPKESTRLWPYPPHQKWVTFSAFRA